MKRRSLLRKSAYGLLVLAAFVYGVLVGRFQIAPYSVLKYGYTFLQAKQPTEAITQPTATVAATVPTEELSIYTKTDVSALISIRNINDVSERRAALIDFLWGDRMLPTSMPSTVMEDFRDSRYEDIDSLQRIDKVVITMEMGLDSIAYHFIPKNSNNKVILYHQGHDGDFHRGKEQIKEFLDNGYAVMAFSMPLLGLNNQPTIQLPHNGYLNLTSHNQMKFLYPRNGHPIKYFIEPVVIGLNYLEHQYDYTLVSMVGISGGGWTTTLAAAADPRIMKSFPVAGSYPIYLRSNAANDWGDYEQTAPELYTLVNYLELYILGAYGENRSQLQIINKHDPCCFNGTKWETYLEIVRSRIRELGSGEFDLLLDESHGEHVISGFAVSRILDELER